MSRGLLLRQADGAWLFNRTMWECESRARWGPGRRSWPEMAGHGPAFMRHLQAGDVLAMQWEQRAAGISSRRGRTDMGERGDARLRPLVNLALRCKLPYIAWSPAS